MQRFTNAEMADMHLCYGAAGGNSALASQMYRDRFPQRDASGSRFFTNLHRRLRESGSFSVNRADVGRPRHPDEERIAY